MLGLRSGAGNQAAASAAISRTIRIHANTSMFPNASSETLAFLEKMRLRNITVVCIDRKRMVSRGIFLGDNPFQFVEPVFLAQISVVTFLMGLLHHLLKPLGETSVVSYILGGLLVGPAGLGHIHNFTSTIFPKKSLYPLDTLGLFGDMFFLFIVGVKIDLSILMRSGKKTWAIGILTFILPLLFTIPISFYLRRYITVDELSTSLPFVALLESMTSFHIIPCLLSDLKLINSELGRLATSSSTISAICCWVTLTIAFSVKQAMREKPGTWFMLIFSSFIQFLITVYILRPIVIWMIKRTPEDKPVKEGYLFAIFVMIMGSALCSEAFGQHALFGPMLFGLTVPDGPPLGSALVEKLDCFTTLLLLPLYYASIGLKINGDFVDPDAFWLVKLMALLGTMGKFVGAILPCLYCKMPLLDSFVLGLMLCSLGIIDIQLYGRAERLKYINNECFTIMVMNAVVLTACISPLVRFLYKPSSRFVTYKKRTIQQTKSSTELRILVCIYHQENVPTIINLLEASNPTRDSPIGLYVLHVVELMGRATPLLIAHQLHKKSSSQPSRSDRIINAFRIYEQQNKGNVTLQPFTSISHFATVHDDILRIALDRRASLVIVPFHKQWGIHGSVESAKCRNVNKNVLNNAPCSVGILVDRGMLNSTRSVLASRSFYRIGMIFLGGDDDREALSYALRMAEHPNINVTIIRLVEIGNTSSNVMERKLDADVINEFRLNNVDSDRNVFKEEVVKDGVGTVTVIRSMENSYDLILVGRHHMNASSLLSGLTEWNEFPELGFIGDMLASSDFGGDASVLVVQQHSNVKENAHSPQLS